MTIQEAKNQIEYNVKYRIFTPRVEALQIAIECMEEVEQYRALGTVEELKEAKEKQVAKKVILWQGKKHICPFCHRDIVRTEALDVHCKYCGQALKWGEEDD